MPHVRSNTGAKVTAHTANAHRGVADRGREDLRAEDEQVHEGRRGAELRHHPDYREEQVVT